MVKVATLRNEISFRKRWFSSIMSAGVTAGAAGVRHLIIYFSPSASQLFCRLAVLSLKSDSCANLPLSRFIPKFNAWQHSPAREGHTQHFLEITLLSNKLKPTCRTENQNVPSPPPQA